MSHDYNQFGFTDVVVTVWKYPPMMGIPCEREEFTFTAVEAAVVAVEALDTGAFNYATISEMDNRGNTRYLDPRTMRFEDPREADTVIVYRRGSLTEKDSPAWQRGQRLRAAVLATTQSLYDPKLGTVQAAYEAARLHDAEDVYLVIFPTDRATLAVAGELK